MPYPLSDVPRSHFLTDRDYRDIALRLMTEVGSSLDVPDEWLVAGLSTSEAITVSLLRVEDATQFRIVSRVESGSGIFPALYRGWDDIDHSTEPLHSWGVYQDHGGQRMLGAYGVDLSHGLNASFYPVCITDRLTFGLPGYTDAYTELPRDILRVVETQLIDA